MSSSSSSSFCCDADFSKNSPMAALMKHQQIYEDEPASGDEISPICDFNLIPKQPIGLYNPENEKDSCGVGVLFSRQEKNEIMTHADRILVNMTHRGAEMCDRSGDGAGVCTQIPHSFFLGEMEELVDQFPGKFEYGVGNVFFPKEKEFHVVVEEMMRGVAEEMGFELVGVRYLPLNKEACGTTALKGLPPIRQVFVAPNPRLSFPEKGNEKEKENFVSELNAKLFVLRREWTQRADRIFDEEMKKRENQRKADRLNGKKLKPPLPRPGFYVCSLSSSLIVYKGQLTCSQLFEFFPDLKNPNYVTKFAMVHSRFSTNTFPSWERAQPNRLLCHNGEINTVRGNKAWMLAAQDSFSSKKIGNDRLSSVLPAIEPGGSDSMALDNVLELLVSAGYSLPQAMMILVPEAWENTPKGGSEFLTEELRTFHQFFSGMMEPWDGPANLAFTDGYRYLGGKLDRNGLRPSRFYILDDGTVVLGSEVGLIHNLDDSQVQTRGRIGPGEMFVVDMVSGEVLQSNELKQEIATSFPYGKWVTDHLIQFPSPGSPVPDFVKMDEELIPTEKFSDSDLALTRYSLQTCLYTTEQIELLLHPMASKGDEGLGSMGNDQCLAVLSHHPRLLYDYFKQLFAQVTNPPIDPIREEIVMSLTSYLGPRGNLLEPSANSIHLLKTDNPVLTPLDFSFLFSISSLPSHSDWKIEELDATFDATEESGSESLEAAIRRLCQQAKAEIERGATILIISDRQHLKSRNRIPIPSILASSAIHHSLGTIRSKASLVIASAEIREVHHFCVVFGFGADAVFPYGAYRLLKAMDDHPSIFSVSLGTKFESAIENYRRAVGKGIRKVMAKMGISTLQGYRGSQIFEIIGFSSSLTSLCFQNSSNRIGGIGFAEIEKDLKLVHQHSLNLYNSWMDQVVKLDDGVCDFSNLVLPSPGDYFWRKEDVGGDYHVMTPKMISDLQKVAVDGGEKNFETYKKEVNKMTRKCCVRGLLRFRYDKCEPIPLEDVEPPENIVRRFCTGAMSYGSISKETHETIAIAMNKLGGKSNTGEGGEDETRRSWNLQKKKENTRSAIKQIASGRFGVTAGYLADADELQIKVAQGAKPGEGGELPGHKVSVTIAQVRHSTPGVGLISPPPHHDIYSIEDLKQLIFDLKNANPKARISVKLVSEVGVGIIAAGVAKAGADHILVSGQDGGTGAAKLTSLKHAGQVWELGLAETQQTLVMNRLRQDVVLQTDGGIRTGRDVIYAALSGAEEFGFGTVPLIALGCIMMRKCHLNTCPVGVATQDPVLRAKFSGKPEHLINYFFALAEDTRQYMARMGFRTIDQMIGRSDLLDVRQQVQNRWGAGSPFNLSALTVNPNRFIPRGVEQPLHFVGTLRPRGLDDVVDQQLLKSVAPLLSAISQQKPLGDFGESQTFGPIKICSIDRTVGTMLSFEIASLCGDDGFPAHFPQVTFLFTGSAGQSFAAWLIRGVTVELRGDANDFVAKGLSGGKVIIAPPRSREGYLPEKNVIAGNVVLYGAIEGKAFFHGMVADRFAVRNSGAHAICEGVGDHACEYMTGGKIIILGRVGRNFGAGMSGGVVWIYQPSDSLMESLLSNPAFKCCKYVKPSGNCDDFDQDFWSLLSEYAQTTGSVTAKRILSDTEEHKKIVRVVPTQYAIQIAKLKEEQGHKNEEQNKKEQEESSNAELEGEFLSTIYKKQASPEIGDIEDLGVTPGLVENKLKGFMKISRNAEKYRSVKKRVKDWEEIWVPHETDNKRFAQAARCMDCGIPTCHSEYGCPVDNKIPEWNSLVHSDQWKLAYERLSETNPFPEFTGRVCPAPCEGACVLSIVDQAVTIKNIENSIIERAFKSGWVQPQKPPPTSFTLAIIGSGPAGLAAAQKLASYGHQVTVFERAEAIGGLLRFGIPNVKLDKMIVERRLDILRQMGVKFIVNSEIDAFGLESMKSKYSAVIVATGATKPRELPIPGSDAPQVQYAMSFLHSAQAVLDANVRGDRCDCFNESDDKYCSCSCSRARFNAKGKNVIVIGAGDTGCDCIATSVRQGCASVTNFSLMFKPPLTRGKGNEWPAWPSVFRVEYGHEEAAHHQGSDPRKYCIFTKSFVKNEKGDLVGIETVEVEWTRKPGVYTRAGLSWKEIPNSTKIWKCDLALLAIGYAGVEIDPDDRQPTSLGLKVSQGKLTTSQTSEYKYHATGNVFVAGDCRRGQSLVVWAIKEGKDTGQEVHDFLMSSKKFLPLQ